MIGLGEASKSKELTQDVELIVSGLRPCRIVADRGGIDGELLAEKLRDFHRHGLTWVDRRPDQGGGENAAGRSARF
jgi:hypothetical protein